MSRGRSAVLCVAALLFAALVKPVQDRIESLGGNGTANLDELYFSSPALLKAMALGYESLLGDIYWMRAIQYYGRRDEADKRPVRYKNLSRLFDIATTLDPDFVDAYRAGSSLISEADPIGAGQPAEALKLLDKGIARHPGEWRLYFDKGFVYFWFLKDFQRAGNVWLAASRLADTPPWMQALAAMSLSKGGAVETARALWLRQYQESNRADVKENARTHLASIQVAEDVWTLEFFLERYREKTGGYPPRLQQLVGDGLSRVPVDPSGTAYQYDPAKGRVCLSSSSSVYPMEVPEAYRGAFLEKLKQRVH